MPGDAGAQSDGALESVIQRSASFYRSIAGMRIEYQENAAIVLAREFTHHQRSGASRSFPMHVAGAVGRNVFAERVKILPAAFVMALDAAFDAGKNFAEFGIRFDRGIDQCFRFQRQAARFLQKTEWKSRDDAERILHVQSATEKSNRYTLFGALLAGNVGEKHWSLEQGGSGQVFGCDRFDAQSERGQSQFLVLQFDGGANGLSGEDVLGKIDFEVHAGQRD